MQSWRADLKELEGRLAASTAQWKLVRGVRVQASTLTRASRVLSHAWYGYKTRVAIELVVAAPGVAAAPMHTTSCPLLPPPLYDNVTAPRGGTSAAVPHPCCNALPLMKLL